MSLFHRAPRDGPDPHLDAKIGLFFLAAAMALTGMFLGSPWVIYGAILVLLLGLLLRFLPSREPPPEDGPGGP